MMKLSCLWMEDVIPYTGLFCGRRRRGCYILLNYDVNVNIERINEWVGGGALKGLPSQRHARSHPLAGD